jgi:zinc/manganese transport system substrate-binding protein
MRTTTTISLSLSALALVAAALGCSTAGGGATSGTLQVVAAENVWGSIAAQLGGDRAHVTSIITSPATDPHGYEPTAADARTMASARFAIVNGAGYDPWAAKLIAATPSSSRVVLTVGDLVGIKAGGNPHRWYSPGDVQKVVHQIVRDYSTLAPQDASYFERQEARFETQRLARYKGLIATIKRKYHGVSVGASESIFAPLAQALGLNLVTPPAFLKAISEGTEPTVSDKTTVDRQVATKQLKIWVFNSQNSTPDVARITNAAREQGIPVATITETPVPESASFEAWQSRQLLAIAAALAKATGT